MSGVDWTTSKSNHFNLERLCEPHSLEKISGSVVIAGLKIIHISLEHYTIGIFSNVFSCWWLISHFSSTSILNWCALQTLNVAQYTVGDTQGTGGGIRTIGFLPERRLCRSFVHRTRLTWPIFQVISMPGHCISRLVIFEKISTVQQNNTTGLSLGWFHVPWKGSTIWTWHVIPLLEWCCPYSGILTYFVPPWNEIGMRASSNNVIFVWMLGSGIMQNTLGLLKSHRAHARHVKFLKTRWLGIQLVEHSLPHGISIFTQTFWTELILTFCTLFEFIQSATSSGNSLCAMFINFGSLMNCISCSWVELKTDCTSCSNTW